MIIKFMIIRDLKSLYFVKQKEKIMCLLIFGKIQSNSPNEIDERDPLSTFIDRTRSELQKKEKREKRNDLTGRKRGVRWTKSETNAR